jgi:hypothetical protein
MGKPKGKRLLGRPVHRWESNFEMVLRWALSVWIGFRWLRIRSSVV